MLLVLYVAGKSAKGSFACAALPVHQALEEGLQVFSIHLGVCFGAHLVCWAAWLGGAVCLTVLDTNVSLLWYD